MTTTAKTAQGEPTMAAVLRELLATPAVKAFVRAGHPSHAAAAAPGVVRALLWQDVSASLSFAKDLPQLANALVAALETLGEELARFPDPLLRSLASELAGGLDLAAARRAARAWLRLALRLAGSSGAQVESIDDDPSLAARALGVAVVAPALRALSTWLEAHPDGLRRLASDLLDPLGPEELRRVAGRAAEQLAALLREHPALSEALARLVASLAWEAVQGSLRAMGGRLRLAGGR